MKITRRSAGLIYGPELHHLDHLAPLCKLLQIPLIVTEEHIGHLARKFYPHLDIIFYDYAEACQHIVQNFDVVFCSMPKTVFDSMFHFAQRFVHKRLHTIWCPSGNLPKDKEEIALVYGKQMIDAMKENGIFDQLKAYVAVGNFRFSFYEREKTFYSRQLDPVIARLNKNKTYLYVPDYLDGSFFSSAPTLIELLPEDRNLIIKIHPLLLPNPNTEKLIVRYEHKKNILFLKEFPPDYPLLDYADLYIGALSPDFLTFDKPMFFIGGDFNQCGVKVGRLEEIYRLIDFHVSSDKEDFSKKRKELYDYTFGPQQDWDFLRAKIFAAFTALPDPELDFL